MRHTYKQAWRLARWLYKALENAPTLSARDAIWHTYERSCWLCNISYSLASKTRYQLSMRKGKDTSYFYCSTCHKVQIGVPAAINAVQVIHGQRIGRSCNYWRCKCGAINRHVWVTGYPTRYELQKEVR